MLVRDNIIVVGIFPGVLYHNVQKCGNEKRMIHLPRQTLLKNVGNIRVVSTPNGRNVVTYGLATLYLAFAERWRI
jgi:hypothetical protein